MLSAQPQEPSPLAQLKTFKLFEQNNDGIYALSRSHDHHPAQSQGRFGGPTSFQPSPRRRLITKRDSSPIIPPTPTKLDSTSLSMPLHLASPHQQYQHGPGVSLTNMKSRLHGMYAPSPGPQRRTLLSDRIARAPSHLSQSAERSFAPSDSTSGIIDVDGPQTTIPLSAKLQYSNQSANQETNRLNGLRAKASDEKLETRDLAFMPSVPSHSGKEDVSSSLLEFARNHETQQRMLKAQVSVLPSIPAHPI